MEYFLTVEKHCTLLRGLGVSYSRVELEKSHVRAVGGVSFGLHFREPGGREAGQGHFGGLLLVKSRKVTRKSLKFNISFNSVKH